MAKFNDAKWRREYILSEGADATRWFENLKFYYEKGLKSPDLRDPAEKKAYIKMAKQFFSKLREGDLEESSIIKEGIEWQAILVKDATVKFNKKPTGGVPGALYFADQGYAKVPKGTFLIGLPGGLFAVNIKKKFAFQLTSGRRTWLDAQDRLKDSDVGGTNMAPEFSQWRSLLNR